jgi:hypothetical protein
MVLIVFRNSLEADVLKVLATLGVSAYTDLPRVVGIGEAGARLDTFERPGFNSLILTALDHDHASRLLEGLRRFRDESAAGQRGARIPLRAFVLPCSQAI